MHTYATDKWSLFLFYKHLLLDKPYCWTSSSGSISRIDLYVLAPSWAKPGKNFPVFPASLPLSTFHYWCSGRQFCINRLNEYCFRFAPCLFLLLRFSHLRWPFCEAWEHAHPFAGALLLSWYRDWSLARLRLSLHLLCKICPDCTWKAVPPSRGTHSPTCTLVLVLNPFYTNLNPISRWPRFASLLGQELQDSRGLASFFLLCPRTQGWPISVGQWHIWVYRGASPKLSVATALDLLSREEISLLSNKIKWPSQMIFWDELRKMPVHRLHIDQGLTGTESKDNDNEGRLGNASQNEE